jgi:hypothetical protein
MPARKMMDLIARNKLTHTVKPRRMLKANNRVPSDIIIMGAELRIYLMIRLL